MKPFPNRTSPFQRLRLSPDSTPPGRGARSSQQKRCSWAHTHAHDPASCQPRLPVVTLESAEALRPATALPVTLVGRDSHGYYGLSVPLPALGISHPTLSGTGTGSGVARVAS